MRFKTIGAIIAIFVIAYCSQKTSSYNNMTPEQAINAYQDCIKDGNDADYCRTQTDVRVRVDNGGNRFFEFMGQYYLMRSILGANNRYVYPRYTYSSQPVWRYYEDSPSVTSPSRVDTSKDSKFGSTRDKSSNTSSSSSSSSFGSSRTTDKNSVTTTPKTTTPKSSSSSSSSFSSTRSNSGSSSSSSGSSTRSSSSSSSSSFGRSSSSGSSSSGRSSSFSSSSSSGKR